MQSNPAEIKPKIEDFYVGKEIGKGNFTNIFLVEELKTKKEFALKQANKRILKSKNKIGDLLMERHCLYRMKSNPWVVDIHSTFQDEINIYIQMELVRGPELWDKIKFFGCVDRNLRKLLLRWIAEAVSSLHASGIVHRDIKPENIMFTESMSTIKFIDFGSAKDLENKGIQGSGNSSTGRRVFHNFVGTPNYMAPECLHNKETGKYTDIFSLGKDGSADRAMSEMDGALIRRMHFLFSVHRFSGV